MAQSIISLRGECTPSPGPSNFLRATLSTITSPTFSEVVVFYLRPDFVGITYGRMSREEKLIQALWHSRLFEVFRETHAVRNFRLVLCAEVWDCVGEYAVQVLKRAVAVENAAKVLDYLSSEPLIIHRGVPEGPRIWPWQEMRRVIWDLSQTRSPLDHA